MLNRSFLFTGLIADQTGSYLYSFYMTGGVLITAFLIPILLIVINRRKSNVQPQERKKADELGRKVSKETQTQELDFKKFGNLYKLHDGKNTRKRSSSAII